VDQQELDDLPVQKTVDPEGLQDVPEGERTLYEIASEPVDRPKKSFWQRPFGRTLRGKNRAGKTIYSVLGLGASMLTGIHIHPVLDALTTPIFQTPITQTPTSIPTIMHFNWINIIVYLALAVLSFLTTRGLVKGLLEQIVEQIEDTIKEFRKARQASSPGGKEVTDREKELILQKAETVLLTLYKWLIRNRLARWFGLKSSQKVPTDEN
jgi:hypothetical protein